MKSSFIKIGCRPGKCTPVYWPSFDNNYRLSLPPCQLVQIANSCGRWTFRSECGYIQTIKQEGLHRDSYEWST